MISNICLGILPIKRLDFNKLNLGKLVSNMLISN